MGTVTRRGSGMLGHDFSSLPTEHRATYLALIRDGTPAAIAQATTLLGRAGRDSAEVKDALAILANRPDPSTAQKQLPGIDRRLAEIDAEVSQLVAERDRLLAERQDVAGLANHSLPAWKRRIGMMMTNPAVVAAVRPELIAAGLLEK